MATLTTIPRQPGNEVIRVLLTKGSDFLGDQILGSVGDNTITGRTAFLGATDGLNLDGLTHWDPDGQGTSMRLRRTTGSFSDWYDADSNSEARLIVATNRNGDTPREATPGDRFGGQNVPGNGFWNWTIGDPTGELDEGDTIALVLWLPARARSVVALRPAVFGSRLIAPPPPVTEQARSGFVAAPPVFGSRVAVVQPPRARSNVVLAPPIFGSRVIAPPPQRVRSGVVLAPPIFGARAIAPRVPSAPLNVRGTDAAHTSLTVEWDTPADAGDTPIIAYEIRVDSGQWIDTGSTALRFALAGLTPGTVYAVAVRARNSNGAGPPSAAVSLRTLAAETPSVPKRLAADSVDGHTVRLGWEPPTADGGSEITGYEVRIDSETGVGTFESVGDVDTYFVCGLAEGHEYGFGVRAVNAVGAGPATAKVTATPAQTWTVVLPARQQILLEDHDRQSMLVTLGGTACRLRVWWQPDQQGWFGSLEAPVNTRLISGRRLNTNTGLLDGMPDVLGGNVVCRALDDTDSGVEPGRDAWRTLTHGLFWEPATS